MCCAKCQTLLDSFLFRRKMERKQNNLKHLNAIKKNYILYRCVAHCRYCNMPGSYKTSVMLRSFSADRIEYLCRNQKQLGVMTARYHHGHGTHSNAINVPGNNEKRKTNKFLSLSHTPYVFNRITDAYINNAFPETGFHCHIE